ncbi:glycosyltransferase [Salegentibacter sp. F188]|uniref:Glycosyltransferase n=1 Tax=Autumnicola patrickiae TaxID=3075591 RepID=A0ABU3DZV2_9FLAO|nr:glycosyltransferase [Salegentibacter sp. F188]MDT0688587.1 glycosyltransferase [Salegentibacter sp. F188]
MNFSLIICTYQRPQALLKLLHSVQEQRLYPDQILIIDGSTDQKTEKILQQNQFKNLEYFQVSKEDRGLTKQRNFGIKKVATSSEIVCFLDDDIVLTPSYFKNLMSTYTAFPDAVGVGGYIIDDVEWRKLGSEEEGNSNEYSINGYARRDSSRFLLRKKLGLMPETFPTDMPPEGHGRSVGFLPPSGKTYQVETFMGGVSSYKKDVFDHFNFSAFFQGYGLYEDTDFTLRLSKVGKLYLNTSAGLYHFHDEDGRPNQFKYGKMVVRNGWYVWRVKYPRPNTHSALRWHMITGLLILIRLSNTVSTSNRKQAFTESIGRITGWLSLIFKKPKDKAV